MTKLARQLTGAAALAAAAAMFGPSAQAASVPAAGLSSAAGTMGLTEHVQYMYRGHRHCFYRGGWHGPGWYRCGYSHRRGLGWGGPPGWHGWRMGRVEGSRSSTSGSANTLRHTNRNSINKAIQRGSTSDEGAAPRRQ